jgi:hypothetical protein
MQLSDKPRKKLSCKFSPNYYFFIIIKEKMQYGKTSYARQDQT